MTKAAATTLPATHDAVSDRVMRAAAKLFRKKGFSATTVREIAAAAQVLPGSLHYRYPSKDDILLALMERGVQTALEAVQEAIAGESDPVERLRCALKAHLNLLLSGEDAIYVVLYDWRSLDGPARQEMVRHRDRYEAFWEGMLYEALGTARLRQHADPKMLRLLGFGAINWVASWYRPGDGWTPDQISDAFFTLFAFGMIREDSRPKDMDSLFASVFPAAPKRRSARRSQS